jgi:hypothetical protein
VEVTDSEQETEYDENGNKLPKRKKKKIITIKRDKNGNIIPSELTNGMLKGFVIGADGRLMRKVKKILEDGTEIEVLEEVNYNSLGFVFKN